MNLVELGRNVLSVQIKHTAKIFMFVIDGVYSGNNDNKATGEVM